MALQRFATFTQFKPMAERSETCSCYWLRGTDRPYGPAVRVIYCLRRHPHEYMPTALTLKNWINSYTTGSIPPLDQNALRLPERDASCA